MKANRVYKQTIQIQKMESRHLIKKKQNEERKKQWEIDFEKMKKDLEDKYNNAYPGNELEGQDEAISEIPVALQQPGSQPTNMQGKQ